MVSVSNITRPLPENSANNTPILLEINDPLIPLADVNVVLEGNFDLDGDGINTFTDPIFNFAQQAWEIRVADRDLIDFETLDSFSLTVRASNGTSRDSGTLDIPLSDVNEAPILSDVAFQALNATTIEAGFINNVTASDPEDNSLFYEIIDGNDPDANGRGAFRIDQGEITLVNPEELTQDYNLTVAVSDPAGLQDTATVTIPVFAAPFVESRELTLDENSAEGTVISLGSDLIQDANTNLADLRVTLTSGNQDSDGDGNFAFSSPVFNPDTGEWELIVNDADELNFEDLSPEELEDGEFHFSLEIQASDGTRADVGVPTIALNDLNEAPVIEDQTFNELNGNNASEFQFVGNVAAFDPDLEQDFPNLAITGGNDPDGNEINAFSVVEDGQIRVANPGELSQDFTLTITATDTEDASLIDRAEITIPIVAAPIVASNTIELPENTENDTAIALDIRDANTPLGDLTVTLLSGNPDNDDDGIKAFSEPTFNEEAGQWELLVTDSDELNFEENNNFFLRIQASDGEQSNTNRPIIALTDVNEAPELTVPEFEQPIDANEIVEQFEQAQAQAEAEEEEIEFPVVDAITEIEDPDVEQSVSTLAITGGNDPDGNEINAFIINEFNELVVLNPQELTQDFTLSITATDDSEEELTSTSELIVPVFAAPIVEDNTVQFLVRENAEGEEETFIPLEISDLDDPIADLSVTLNGGNQDNDGDGEFAFSNPTFNSDTGQWEILVNDFDDLTFDQVDLQIQASDGENAGSGLTRITLVPDVIDNTVEEFEENSPEETPIPLEIEDSNTPLAELEVTLINGNPDLDEDGRSAFNQPTFNAEAGQWEVTVNDSDDLNFEDLSPEQLENGEFHFSLEIEASDGEDSDTGEYDVRLADINEAPVFENSSQLLSVVDIDGIPNDDGNGAIVGQIDGFTDPDDDVSDPEGQNFRFTLNEIGAFNLDSATITATGEIFIGDRAQLSQNVEFEVTVIDSEGAESEPILIGVPADTASNDAPIALDTTLDIVDPTEATINDNLGGVPSADPDGDPISFSIDGGNDSGAFAINENGEIRLDVDPETLTQGEFTLTVTATDGVDSNLTDTAEVTIPVNTAPFLSSETVEIPENSGNDTVIALPLSDVDTPIGDLNVTLRNNQDNDGDDLNAFSEPVFNGETGQWEITITDSDELNLDFENFEGLTVDVTVGDGEITIPSSINVDLTDVNEEPVVEDQTLNEIDPNRDNFVETVSFFEPDNDPLNFAILAGNNDADGDGTSPFRIDEQSGSITINDRDDITQETVLTVSATEAATEDSFTTTAQITIPVNFTPVVENNSIQLPENSDNGTPIPLTIEDGDTPLDQLEVSLLNGNQDNDGDGINVFGDPQFDQGQWQLTVTDSDELDFEGSSRFALEIEANDGVNIGTGFPDVSLTNVNEAPIIEEEVLNTVDPDSASVDQFVDTISVSDPDFSDSIDSVEITSGNPDADGDGTSAFRIDENFGNFELTVQDPDDLTLNFFSLVLTATETNAEGLTGTGEVIIPTPINPVPVVDETLIEIPEDSNVIPLDIEDGNTNLQELTVNLIDGNQDNDGDGINLFGDPQFNEGEWQLTVTDSDELDFEGSPSRFSLEIEANDGINIGTGSPDVSLTDVNEAPIIEEEVLNTVDPDSASVNQFVDTISVSDPDFNDSIASVEITSGNTDADGDGIGAFRINEDFGNFELIVQDPDELTEDFFTLEVTATETNAEGLTGTGEVIVPTPINPFPVIDGSNIDLPENSSVLTLNIQDENTDLQELTVTLVDGNQDNDEDGTNVFGDTQFNSETGEWELLITDTDELDFEQFPNQEFNLEIEAIDPQGNSDSVSSIVSLVDVNEIQDSTLSVDAVVAEEEPLVGSLSISEPNDDGFGVNNVTILDGNDPNGNGVDAFEIQENDLGEFELTVQNPEELTQNSFTLEVEATGGGSLPGTAEITIDVSSVRPVIESNPLKLLEDSVEGDTVALNIRDEDTISENFIVTLVGGNQNLDQDGQFAFGEPIFNSEFGQWELPVNDTDDLDFEADYNLDDGDSETGAFTLEVQVSDGATSAIGFPEIQLTDVNEAPILEPQTLELDVNAVTAEFEQNQENAEEEEEIVLPVVGTIEVTEPDLDQSARLTITGGNDPDGNEINAFAIEETENGGFQLVLQNPEELTQDFNLEITATDDSDAALSSSAELIVDITAAPSFGEIDSLPENSPDGTVIPLGIQDADTPLEDLTVTLEDGNQDTDGDGVFAFSEPVFNSETGEWELIVNDSDELDFEQTPPDGFEFNLELEARDDQEITTVNPTLSLEDVNEAPTVEDQTLEVNANEVLSFDPVETIVVSEPDFGQSLGTLAVTGGNDPDGNEVNAFIINESNELTVLNPDELTQDFVLTITATDDSEEQVTGTGEINVSVTAAPIVADDPIELPENSPEGTVIPLDISDLNTATADLTVNLNEGNQDLDGDGIFAFSNPSFNTDAGQWELTVTDPDDLDFESENNRLSLELQASDGEQANSGSPEIVLTDVNEAPVGNDTTLPLLNTATIEAGDVVGNASITDPEGDLLEFTINSGDDNGAFTIDEAGDISIVDPSLISAPFQLEISATETETDEQNATTAVVTVPVDTPPAFVETEFTVPENSAIDFEVGQVVINEDEGLESLSLESANFDGDENPALRIDEQGNVFVNDADDIDFEANSGLLLGELTATNVNGLTQSAILTVNVQDVNEIPTVEEALFSPIAVGESSIAQDNEEALLNPIAAGESFIFQDDQVEIEPVVSDDLTGVVSANDPDLGESPTLDIIAGNNDADGDGTEAVAIESFVNGGADIIVTDPDDVRENLRLTVEVSDRGGDTNQATVVIPVNGEGNQAPIAENATLNIVENSSGGTVVGTFPHTDPDFNNLQSQEKLTFSINQGNTDVDGDGLSAFRIDRFSGEILVADRDDLNFESADNRSFELEVVVTDLEGATDTAEVTVNLEDVNEAPVINNRFLERVTLNPITNPTEAADGDIVGAIAASDPDGTTLSYEILSGNDPEENLADAFAINSDGEVSIANIEEIPDFGSFPLTVAISDETGLTTETELVIPLGTQAPTIAADQSFTIPEDAAFETVVGTVNATEPDGEEISYFLASSQQEGLPAFEIDRATGEIVVSAPNALDFETQSAVELTVVARDPQQAIGVETVTVNLENVNEAPTFDENSTSFAIPASSQAGRGVGVVAAFDEDGDTVSYAIVGGNDNRDGDDTNPFTINAETGEVTVADADDLLTLEDNPFRLEVQARDGELNNTAEVDITALPAAPVIPNNGATFPINATSFAGALVDTVEAFDPDEGELSFAFSAGNEDRDGDENNPFRINTETGAIIVTDADDVADIEANPFELSVLVTDEDGDTTTGNFTVTSGTGTVSTSDGISFSTPLPDRSEAELEQDLNNDGDTEDTVTPEPSNLVRPAIGSTEILSIENTGNAPLLISDVVVSEGLRDRVTTDFDALVEATTPVDDNGEALFDLPGVEIPVGANLELAVTYTPDAGGEVIDEAAGLTLFSNDPENGELNVALSGESTFNSDIDYNGSVGFPDVTLADSLFNTSSEELNPALNIDGEGGFGFSDLATLNQEFGASIA